MDCNGSAGCLGSGGSQLLRMSEFAQNLWNYGQSVSEWSELFSLLNNVQIHFLINWKVVLSLVRIHLSVKCWKSSKTHLRSWDEWILNIAGWQMTYKENIKMIPVIFRWLTYQLIISPYCVRKSNHAIYVICHKDAEFSTAAANPMAKGSSKCNKETELLWREDVIMREHHLH